MPVVLCHLRYAAAVDMTQSIMFMSLQPPWGLVGTWFLAGHFATQVTSRVLWQANFSSTTVITPSKHHSHAGTD